MRNCYCIIASIVCVLIIGGVIYGLCLIHLCVCDGNAFVTAIANVGLLLTAVISACVAYRQYQKHVEEERVKLLCEYNQRYSIDENVRCVVKWMLKFAEVDTNGDILKAKEFEESKDIGIYEKEMFMRFFEELYLQIKAGNLKSEEVFQLFAYYALKYDECEGFRKNIEDYQSLKEQQTEKKKEKRIDYWANFRNFIEEMKKIELKQEQKMEQKDEPKEEQKDKREANHKKKGENRQKKNKKRKH